MKASGELVFVYGTLRRGASNHWRMEEAEFVCEACVLGHLYPIDWYPGMVLDDDGVPVQGEVYRVDAGLLEKLDEFEGVTGEGVVADEYARVRTEVQAKTGPGMEAWVWEYRREVGKRTEIVPADWVNPGPAETSPLFVIIAVVLGIGGFIAI